MAIQTLNTIKTWFKTGLKPSQNQFWDTWDSFRHKYEKVPLKDVEDLESTLSAKAEKLELNEHTKNESAHTELFSKKEDITSKGSANGYVPLNEFTKIAAQYLNIVNDLTTGGTTSLLSAEQGVVLQDQIDSINQLLACDNINLNTIQKIAQAIGQVQISLNTILINDLTTGGATKALTAEMGKILNEKKLEATIATDYETQINEPIQEDNKIVSRLKLFNWWKWRISFPEEITGLWNFVNGLKVEKVVGENTHTTEITEHFIAIKANTSNGFMFTVFQNNLIRWYEGGFSTFLRPETPTQDNDIKFPNKSGTVAVTNDFITTAAGTTSTPALKIPSGSLTTIPQNGAIEHEPTGYYLTRSGVRSRIITTDDGLILVAYKSLSSIQTNLDTPLSATIERSSSSTIVGKIPNTAVLKLNSATQIVSSVTGSSLVKPTVAKVEVFLKINNGLFATHYTGSGAVNQVKIMEYSGLNNYGYKNYQNIILTNMQASTPQTSQWSTIDFALQNVTDGVITSTDKSYYLRDAANSRTFGAAEASFTFVFVNTLVYADATNAAGQNAQTLLRATNYALYIESIR